MEKQQKQIDLEAASKQTIKNVTYIIVNHYNEDQKTLIEIIETALKNKTA